MKNPANRRKEAEIHYHDIGDYLSRADKLERVRSAAGLSGLNWKTITPNAEGDWLNLRDPLFQSFVELGNAEVKRGKVSQPETVFRSYSSGVKTNRDAWAYNLAETKLP